MVERISNSQYIRNSSVNIELLLVYTNTCYGRYNPFLSVIHVAVAQRSGSTISYYVHVIPGT